MSDILALKEAIYEVGLLFSKATQPDEAQTNAYARALQRYTPQQVTYAFNQIILKGGAHFPSLADVLIHLRPKETSGDDFGNIVANEVIQKVIDFGVYRLQEAFDALSENSKAALSDNRYILAEIANSERDQLPTIRAQIRGMAKANYEAKKSHVTNKNLEKLGIVTPTIEHGMKKLSLVDFNE